MRDSGDMKAQKNDTFVVFPIIGVSCLVFSGLGERHIDGWVSQRVTQEEACQTPAINGNDKGLTSSSWVSPCLGLVLAGLLRASAAALGLARGFGSSMAGAGVP